MAKESISASMIQESFSSVFQSRKKLHTGSIQNTHKFYFNIKTIAKKIIKGTGYEPNRKRGRPKTNFEPQKKRICKEKREIINMQDFINNNKCVIRVVNSDNFCLLRAILIGKAFVDKERNASHLVRKNNRKLNERL